MNEGTLSRKALGRPYLPLALAGMCPEVPRGSWSGWSVRLEGGGTCFWAVVTMEMAASAGYVCKEGGGATTWSQSGSPGITNMPGTRDHLAPSPWAGQRNEIWVSSTAVKAE